VTTEEIEPTKVALMTVEQFIQQAQEPQMAALIDTMIDTIQSTTGADDRKMLRGFILVLRAIATSMPWNEDEGLDARLFHKESKTVMPSWRDCIGALLQLEFSKPDDVEVDAEIEDSQKEAIQAEEEAEADKVEETQDDGIKE